MEIKFHNITQKIIFDQSLVDIPESSFLNYDPDWETIERLVDKYKNKEHVLVIGQGGSVTSTFASYNALRKFCSKKLHFLWTIDPERITILKSELTPENSVVVVVSKSGQTLTTIEGLSQFLEFECIVISQQGSPLEQLSRKLTFDFLSHPEIGGRFSGFTEVTILPLAIAGLDVKAYLNGGKELHKLFKKDNLAFKAAAALSSLEDKGFVDVLGLFYSSSLAFSENLIMQLAHESFGKDNRGQTFVIAEGPEVQHHSLQRFLGGTKNMVGFFVGLYGGVENYTVNLPPILHSIPVRGVPLFDLQKLNLQDILKSELEATLETASSKGLPLIYLELAGIDEINIGRWIAFWQLFAVYSSLLRKVNPFDQPAVEESKELAVKKRLALKGLT